MNLFQQFKKSFYSFEEYPVLAKVNGFKVLLYTFLLSLIVFVMIIIPIAAVFNSMGGYSGLIEKYVPEFTMKDGVFHTEKNIDFESKTEGIKILIDNDAEINTDMLKEFPIGILINSEEAIMRSSYMVQTFEFSQYKDEVFTKEHIYDFVPIFRKMTVLFSIIMFIFYFIFDLFQVLMFSFAAFLVNHVIGAKITLTEIIKICVYARTMPLLLKAILALFGIGMPFFIYFAVVLIYIYIALKNCKNKDGCIIAVL